MITIKNSLNVKYAVLQMLFWTAAASGYAFMTQILLDKGFSSTEVGILNAVKLFSTVVFQVLIGSFSDRNARKIPLKYIIAVISCFAAILTAVFWLVPLNFVETIILFVGFGASFTCIPPLIDALAVIYTKNGKPVNFPVGRAAGSAAWAAACVGFGLFCDTFGVSKLLPVQMAFTGGILVAAISMNPISYVEKSDMQDKQEKVNSTWYLLGHYPKFTLFLFGSAVMFMGYSLGTTFLINVIEELGGGNSQYGMAEFVMAASEIPAAYIMAKYRKKIPLDKLMIVCAFFMMLKNAFATYSGNVTVIIVSQVCEMLGFGLYYAGGVYLVESMLPAPDIVKGVSLINVATVGMGEGIASLFCGMLKEKYGLHMLMQTSVMVSALSIVCMCIMCCIKSKRNR